MLKAELKKQKREEFKASLAKRFGNEPIPEDIEADDTDSEDPLDSSQPSKGKSHLGRLLEKNRRIRQKQKEE